MELNFKSSDMAPRTTDAISASTAPSEYLTIKAVATYLNCCVSQVYRLKDSGELESICVGAKGRGIRIKMNSVYAFEARRARESVRRAQLQKSANALSAHLTPCDQSRAGNSGPASQTVPEPSEC